MAFVTAVVIAIAATAVEQNDGADITGTISKAEPASKEDGTLAYPYADASRCPSSTDVIIWPKDGRPVPSLPSGLSVCFVGTQSFNNSGGADLKKR